MNHKTTRQFTAMPPGLIFLVAMLLLVPSSYAEDAEIRGFVENATFFRDHGVGLTKSKSTLQVELGKAFDSGDFFSEVSVHGIFRGSYDAVYDFNDDTFGENSGRSVSFPAPGNPSFFSFLVDGNPTDPPPFPPSTNPVYAGIFPPPVLTGAIPLPGVPGGNIGAGNPNEGLGLVGEDVHHFEDGSVVLAYPTRPCDFDGRGCIDGYMDDDLNELRFAEFNSRWDFMRELYLDAALPAGGGEFGFRIGRQQIVWGRTDLFRVLDVINPVDFARQNIYDELEDARIPMGIFNLEYRAGAKGPFEDLNFQGIWKFEDFRPNNLGQGGEPYAILGAGNFFRAMKNCWDNGCTVWNFPASGLAVEFPKHSLGIRQANVPEFSDEQDYGFRMEGVVHGVGFSLNYLRYTSQMPSLRGGIDADNPFTPQTESQFFPYALAFDIDFPRLTLVGASADFYVEALKSAFRVEVAHTSGEEFPNTLEERLFSESDVLRWVIGIDRPTFIPFLNKTRAFLLSLQVFGQHLLDHELQNVNAQGVPTLGPVGMVDWKNNYLMTFLFQGNYLNDRLTPQILTAYDFEAGSGTVSPSIDWKIDNNWQLTAAINFKYGDGALGFDDNRAANPYPPFTCAPPIAASGSPLCGIPYSSLGVSGFEPIGRFRAGPIGMAINEDEYQLTLRYRF
ncbi:MAG TPA: DUF1302 family protein [Xanthomonadales bacterium]|nr:DUF1302 family protein [Xanthomonadales bacterium]